MKLWREYKAYIDLPRLYCVDCALKKTKSENGGMHFNGPADVNGQVMCNYDERAEFDHKTDSIGWLLPALPHEDGTAFWDFNKAPSAWVAWWKKLPNHNGVTKEK